jgi:hypothetical protein
MYGKEDDLEELKKKILSYKETEIEFNDPHFSQQLAVREGSKKEVISHLLNPEKLVYSYSEKGKYGDIIHCLHFKISNTRTMRLPVIFDRDSKKGLYIITYIMRYRHWQSMVKREGKVEL